MTVSPEQDAAQEPKPNESDLRFLRRLVLVLTTVMIGGFILIVIMLVIRLQSPSVTFPQNLQLPDGVEVMSYTQGAGWAAIVSQDQRILLFNAQTGKVFQEIAVEHPQPRP